MSNLLKLGMTLAIVATVLPSAASAQTRPVTFGFGGGPSFPTGHLAEDAGTGFHVRGSVGFSVPVLPVGVRAELLWQQFPDEHEGSFQEAGGLLNAVVALPIAIGRPYAFGGVGLINHTPPEEEHGDHAHEGESETSFAYNLGAGLELGIAGFNVFAEARYLDGGVDHRAVPITFGLRF